MGMRSKPIAMKKVGEQVVPMQASVSWLTHWLGRFWMKLWGWKIEADPFPGDKFVLIGAPHTSNVDFLYMIATAFSLRLKLFFIGKHTLFWPPLGWILTALGGIPVDRRASHGVVDQVAERIRGAEKFILVVAPSGTRGHSEYWKSGFYWIASKAQVPIVLGALDYDRKLVRLGNAFEPSGDIHTDMESIREYYMGVKGRFPDNQTPIRLREEVN
jgi:1-acyl-sn-glycerol-3-phosphate acyltransferase